jgi:hypothetical protein
MGLGLVACSEASAPWPTQLHSARGTATTRSSLLAPQCGLAGEDEESPGSTPEVAMRTGTHRRRMSMMRWFGGGETMDSVIDDGDPMLSGGWRRPTEPEGEWE